MDYYLRLFRAIWRHTDLEHVICRPVPLRHLYGQKIAHIPHQKSHCDLLISDKIYSIQLKNRVLNLFILKLLVS